VVKVSSYPYQWCVLGEGGYSSYRPHRLPPPSRILAPAVSSFGLTNVGRRLAGMCQNVEQTTSPSWFLFAPKAMIKPSHLPLRRTDFFIGGRDDFQKVTLLTDKPTVKWHGHRSLAWLHRQLFLQIYNLAWVVIQRTLDLIGIQQMLLLERVHNINLIIILLLLFDNIKLPNT